MKARNSRNSSRLNTDQKRRQAIKKARTLDELMQAYEGRSIYDNALDEGISISSLESAVGHGFIYSEKINKSDAKLLDEIAKELDMPAEAVLAGMVKEKLDNSPKIKKLCKECSAIGEPVFIGPIKITKRELQGYRKGIRQINKNRKSLRLIYSIMDMTEGPQSDQDSDQDIDE